MPPCKTPGSTGAGRFVRGDRNTAARAGDGTRTRDIKLGRLALYQLSYSRVLRCYPLKPPAVLQW